MTPPPFGAATLMSATAGSVLLAARALRKKSLTPAGAAAGLIVGFAIVATGLRGTILFAFYQIGTMATKYKMQVKQQVDGTIQQAAVRGAGQVLCASAVATLLSLWHAIQCGTERPIQFISSDDPENDDNTFLASQITCAILAHHATSLADTLASELGMLWAQRKPVLITQPWRQVPIGTNGGVTLWGFVVSFLGGIIIGLLYVLVDTVARTEPVQVAATICFGGICGLLGSVLDSILGATVQATYYNVDDKKVYHSDAKSSLKHLCGVDILTNEQVNLVSLCLASYLGGWLLGPWFFALYQ